MQEVNAGDFQLKVEFSDKEQLWPVKKGRLTMFEGRILQVIDGGLAYLEDVKSGKRYAFRFGKIRDYNGETARQLGLRAGCRILFTATADIVESVELLRSPQLS